MTDRRQRTLARRAVTDGPEARERALRSRLRLHPGATEAWELPMPTRACESCSGTGEFQWSGMGECCQECDATGQVPDPRAYAEAVAPLLVAAFDRDALVRVASAIGFAINVKLDMPRGQPGSWRDTPEDWDGRISTRGFLSLIVDNGAPIFGPRLRDVVREAIEQDVSR